MMAVNLEAAYIFTAALLLCLSPAAQSANMISPPSGSVISARVNATNVTTITCELYHPSISSLPQLLDWRLDNVQLNGNPNFLRHGNFNLTILRFASELDGQTLTCEGGNTGLAANFSIVVFRPPNEITLTTTEKSDTWIRVSWEVSNLGTPPITYYQISIMTVDRSNVTNSTTRVNSTARATTLSELLPNTTYTVTVTSFTILTKSVEAGPTAITESIQTELPQDTVPYLLVKKIEEPCRHVLANRSAYDILLAETTSSVRSEIQNNCNCTYRMGYLYDTKLNCTSHLNENVLTFQASMLVTPQWTREQSLAFAAQAPVVTTNISQSNNASETTTLGAPVSSGDVLPVAVPAATATVIVVVAIVVVAAVLVVVWIAVQKRKKKLKDLPSETIGCIVLNEHKPEHLGPDVTGKQKLPDRNLNKNPKQHQASSSAISDVFQLEKLDKVGTPTTNNTYTNEAKASPQKNGVKHNKSGVPSPHKNAVNSTELNTYITIEKSTKEVPPPELEMYEMMEAVRKNSKQTSPFHPLPPLSSSSEDKGQQSVELDTYAVIENSKSIKAAKVAALPLTPPPTQASRINMELDLYQTIDAAKETEKNSHQETSFVTEAPPNPPPNPPPNEPSSDPLTPVIYAEVVVPRGKSLRGRHKLNALQGNTTANEEQTDGQLGSDTQLHGNSDTERNTPQCERKGGKDDDNNSKLSPFLPPRTAKEDISKPNSSPDNSIVTSSDILSARKTSTQSSDEESTTGDTSNDEEMNNEERKGTETEQAEHEEQEEDIPPPPVPPETTAKYITIETTEVVEESLYADCTPTSVPATRLAVSLKHVPNTQNLETGQPRGRFGPSSETPPSSRKLPLPSSPLSNTPSHQSINKDTAPNLQGKWNTLRPKSRNKGTKESNNMKSRTARLGTNMHSGASEMGNRVLSMTNLVETDKDTGKKTPPVTNKVPGLKSMVGLWKKKATDSSLPPSKKGEEVYKRDGNFTSSRDGKSPLNAIISSPQLVASTPDQDLVYAELTTTARRPMPSVTQLSPMTATQKPSLQSKEFPSISQLVDEAKRNRSPTLARGLNPTGGHKSPQRGSNSPTSGHCKDSGVTQQHQEDQLYEVMTNVAKPSLKSPTEEQLYETMMGSTRPQNMTPTTADEQYEVMSSIRPKRR